MPSKAKELSAAQVAKLGCKQGRDGKPRKTTYAVGGADGLMLQVSPPKGKGTACAKSWLLRLRLGERRLENGLGSYPTVSLKMAREDARALRAEFREKIRQGIDPIAEQKALRSSLIAAQAKDKTMADMAAMFIAKKEQEFSGRDVAKRIAKLRSRTDTYILPEVGEISPADVELAHVKRILNTLWTSKPETAKRVQLDIEKMLDLAAVEGLRKDQNPARWKGFLDQVMPKQKAKAKNHAALAPEQIPAFYKRLVADETAAAQALAFQILTASRPGEARLARWDQLDLKEGTWTIEAEDMKSGKKHVVPLSAAALDIIKNAPLESDIYVFKPPVARRLDENTLTRKAKEVGEDAGLTAHGFRSTFKDWCRTATAYEDELSELALAHVFGDATRLAYARDGLIDRRRLLMADWAHFCEHGKAKSGTVVAIGGQKSW